MAFLDRKTAITGIGASRFERRPEASVLDFAGEALNAALADRSEEHTSELQSLMRNSYAVFCLKKKTRKVEKTIQTARQQWSDRIVMSSEGQGRRSTELVPL